MPLYSQSGYGSGGYGISDAPGPLIAESLAYYLALLTSEYRMAPKLNGWLYRLLTPLDDASNCIFQMQEAFDLDTAEGVQLDLLGTLIMGSADARTLPFQPSDSVSPVLDDETFRLLLRATIAINHWDGLVSSLQPIWASLFTGGKITIIDNQNMSATVVMSGGLSSLTQDMIRHGLIVPRPETVQYTYVFSDQPLFGFSKENSAYIAGFDLGVWS